MVMEWCPQGDLAYHINEAKNTNKKFEEQQISRWFAQMGDALAYIHSRRVLHRDLKSTNVFVDAEMNLKLGDLGIAKILESTLARASSHAAGPSASKRRRRRRQRNHKGNSTTRSGSRRPASACDERGSAVCFEGKE